MFPLKRLTTVVLGVFTVFLAGCGSATRYVPVSGVVTFNGKPYRDATITFDPIGVQGRQEPGRSSMGVTDENGRFTLTSLDGQNGAVVGKHRVSIASKIQLGTAALPPGWDVGRQGTPDTGDLARAKLPTEQKIPIDPIPPDWRSGKVEFEVPSGGTDKANFNIKK